LKRLVKEMEAVVGLHLPSYCESRWSVIGNEVAHTAMECHSTMKQGANHVDVGEGSDELA
jgi:hypothetical protein